jgi:hypothetical protein
VCVVSLREARDIESIRSKDGDKVKTDLLYTNINSQS